MERKNLIIILDFGGHVIVLLRTGFALRDTQVLAEGQDVHVFTELSDFGTPPLVVVNQGGEPVYSGADHEQKYLDGAAAAHELLILVKKGIVADREGVVWKSDANRAAQRVTEVARESRAQRDVLLTDNAEKDREVSALRTRLARARVALTRTRVAFGLMTLAFGLLLFARWWGL